MRFLVPTAGQNLIAGIFAAFIVNADFAALKLRVRL